MNSSSPGAATTIALLLTALLSVTAVPAAGSLPHEDGPRNHTVTPVSIADHQPGIEDASYYRFAAPNGDPDFESLRAVDHIVTRWEAGVINRCSPAEVESAGIDRGNDDPGTTVDVDITVGQYVESQYGTAHELHVEFTDGGGLGRETLRFGADDEFVVHHVECWQNPEEPGWYQVSAVINGTTRSGEHQRFGSRSHHFWICDCRSDAEARHELGLPPSAPDDRTPSMTAPPERTTTSPTPGDGNGTATAPGFGPAVALVGALLALAALGIRRRRAG